MDITADLQELVNAAHKGIAFLQQYRELLNKLPYPNDDAWATHLRTFEGIQKLLELAEGGWSLHLAALYKNRTLH